MKKTFFNILYIYKANQPFAFFKSTVKKRMVSKFQQMYLCKITKMKKSEKTFKKSLTNQVESAIIEKHATEQNLVSAKQLILEN